MDSSFSRRTFLKHGGLAVAGAALPPAVVAADSRRPAAAPAGAEKPFVELAIATICTDGFANKRHEPAFRLIPEVGIKNVEFNVWFPDVITPNYFRGLKERSVRAGLKPVCVQGSGFGGEGASGVQKDVGHKLALMYGARELGCRRVKCTGAGRGTQGGLKSVIEVCKELAPAAKELDQIVLLENHAKNVLETIADYEEIFAAIDSPHIAMCCDVAHFWGSGIDPLEVIEKFHSRILHVDLKDNRTKGGGHDVVPYGEGITDFKAICDALIAKNYSGYLLIEMAWREPREPIVENLKKGRDLFQPYTRA
jgi:sugar phosphate isomerase/epimerase